MAPAGAGAGPCRWGRGCGCQHAELRPGDLRRWGLLLGSARGKGTPMVSDAPVDPGTARLDTISSLDSDHPSGWVDAKHPSRGELHGHHLNIDDNTPSRPRIHDLPGLRRHMKDVPLSQHCHWPSMDFFELRLSHYSPFLQRLVRQILVSSWPVYSKVVLAVFARWHRVSIHSTFTKTPNKCLPSLRCSESTATQNRHKQITTGL